ncbi:MAG TPA: flagellar basal body-associated FliL family protein [Spirochaetota bacterium]|nr:flagellar basal body-associated FliL family protein [Spirochaetota bacterium]
MKNRHYIIRLVITACVLGSFVFNLQAQDIVAAGPPDPLDTYELPKFAQTTVDAEPHFIKMIIVLGYEKNPELKNELNRRKDEIQYIINKLLRSKRYDELDEVSDIISLSEEIRAHINAFLIAGRIKEIYFKEFVLN